MPKRFDRASQTNFERTPQGFLKINLRATRVGVLSYRTADGGSIRELRHPDEVFKPESIETMKEIPFTNEHPYENGILNFVTIDNAKRNVVGFTSNTVSIEDDRYLTTSAIVMDARTIDQILEGKLDISAGYACKRIPEAGVYNGEEYDYIQRDIQYNHIAVTEAGRAGKEVSIRLDSEDAVESSGASKNAGRNTMIIELNGKEAEVPDDFGQVFNDFMKVLADAASDDDTEREKGSADRDAAQVATEVKKNMDSMKATLDHQAAEIKKMRAQLQGTGTADSKKAFNQKVAQRIQLLATAKACLPNDQHERLDSIDDLDIMRQVIRADDAEAVLDGKTEAYIHARYDHLASKLTKVSRTHSEMGAGIANPGSGKDQAGALGDRAEKARRAQTEAARGFWKKAAK